MAHRRKAFVFQGPQYKRAVFMDVRRGTGTGLGESGAGYRAGEGEQEGSIRRGGKGPKNLCTKNGLTRFSQR